MTIAGLQNYNVKMVQWRSCWYRRPWQQSRFSCLCSSHDLEFHQPVPFHQTSPGGLRLGSGDGLLASSHTCDQNTRCHWPDPALISSPALLNALRHQSGGWEEYKHITPADIGWDGQGQRVGGTCWKCHSTAETCGEGSCPGRRRTGGHPETDGTEEWHHVGCSSAATLKRLKWRLYEGVGTDLFKHVQLCRVRDDLGGCRHASCPQLHLLGLSFVIQIPTSHSDEEHGTCFLPTIPFSLGHEFLQCTLENVLVKLDSPGDHTAEERDIEPEILW